MIALSSAGLIPRMAYAEIDAFKADPTSVELNSITNKICVELVRKSKETHTNEQNSAGSAPDIFGGDYSAL